MAKSGINPRNGRMTMKSGRGKANDKAAQARARMAGRAKRARFFKENKKRITYGFLLAIAVVLFAFFTPFGPDWYYGKLQDRKWESNGAVKEGYIAGLYKLGSFYSFTFRKEKAAECYNEMASLYYGFTFEEFAVDPGAAMEKRYEGEDNRAKGLRVGPPFKVAPGDLPFIGFAIKNMAEMFITEARRGFARNLVRTLFIEDFLVENPTACPPEFNEEMRNLAFNLS